MDAYQQDFRRYCLAMTMLRQGARPSSVRQWAGFTRQRMRMLVRIYNENRAPGDPGCVPGPTFSALSKLLKDPQLRMEFTAAATLCRVLSVYTEGSPKSFVLPSVEAAERVSHAFEVYGRLVPNGHLTLEHLLMLVLALGKGDCWALEPCSQCDWYVLVDPLSLKRRLCSDCLSGLRTNAVDTSIPAELEFSSQTDRSSAGFQRSLF